MKKKFGMDVSFILKTDWPGVDIAEVLQRKLELLSPGLTCEYNEVTKLKRNKPLWSALKHRMCNDSRKIRKELKRTQIGECSIQRNIHGN